MGAVILPTGEKVADPATVGYIPRTEFMRSLCGEYDTGDDKPLEDVVWEATRSGWNDDQFDARLYDLACTYRKYRDQGARLPAFGRWISSMFQKDTKLNQRLGQYGQKQASPKIIISDRVEDILRAGNVVGFSSCLAYDGNDEGYKFHYVVQEIARACPGIAVAYTTNKQGQLTGRCFINHAVDKATKKDMVCLNPARGGVRHDLLKRIFDKKGIMVAALQPEWYAATTRFKGSALTQKVTLVGNFNRNEHYDVIVHPADQLAAPL